MTNYLKRIQLLPVAALILGAGAAFTTVKSTSSRLENKMYGFDQLTSSWVDITGLQESDETTVRDYRCDASSNTCSAEFPEDVNPNDQNNDAHPGTVAPSNIQPGDFSLE